jgi:hypothetical protein
VALEDGDLDEETESSGKEPSAAANDLCRKIADAPAANRPMIEKVVEDLLDALRKSA